MYSIKNAILGVCGLLVLAAIVLGVRNSAGASPHSRELSRAEMAGLFGRQPNPVVGCAGCYLDRINTPSCDQADPCICAQVAPGKTSTTCNSVSQDPFNFTTVGRSRPKGTDKANTDDVYTESLPCFVQYNCVTGTAVPAKACGTNTCNMNAAGTACQPCTRGMLQYTNQVGNDYCEVCAD